MTTAIALVLILQTLFAVAGLWVLDRRLLRDAEMFREPRLLLGVWAPIAIVLPMLVLAVQVGENVRGVGWVPIAAPIWTGTLILGLALLVLDDGGDPITGIGPLLVWAATGLLLLLLAAVHDLTVWIGQFTFVVAAAVLWSNTPARKHGRVSEASADGGRGAWTLLAVLAGAGQGVCALLTAGLAANVSTGLLVGYGAAAAVLAVRALGPRRAIELGGWTASIGMLLGIGVISLLFLAPQTLAIVRGQSMVVQLDVAHSFGAYAFEAVLLLLLPLAILAAPATPAVARRVAGIAVIALLLALAAWRVVAV